MRMSSLSENNLWSAFSETGQLSVTSTADLHSPSSAETGLSFPQLSVTSIADLPLSLKCCLFSVAVPSISYFLLSVQRSC